MSKKKPSFRSPGNAEGNSAPAAAQREKAAGYLPALTGLRAVAFAAVFLLHCYSGRFSYAAAWAVELFFLLSAYLYGRNAFSGEMAEGKPESDAKLQAEQGFQKEEESAGRRFGVREAWSTFMAGLGSETVQFVKKRLSRLYPLHLLMLLAVLPLYHPAALAAAGDWEGLRALAGNVVEGILLLQSWDPVNAQSMNGVSWFLSTLLFLYLLTPLLLRVGRRLAQKRRGLLLRTIRWLLLLQLVIVLGIRYGMESAAETAATGMVSVGAGVTGGAEYWLYTFPPIRLVEYAIGLFAGIASRTSIRVRRREGGRREKNGLFLCLVLLLGILCLGIQLPEFLWRSTIWIIPNLLLLWLLSEPSGENSRPFWGSRLLSLRPLVWLGSISFELYLIHQVVYRYLYLVEDRWDSSGPWKLCSCAAALIMSLLLAEGFHWLSGRLCKKKRL